MSTFLDRMSKKWILAPDGKTPVECDLLTWAKWLEGQQNPDGNYRYPSGKIAARSEGRTNVYSRTGRRRRIKIRVSTVFLGLDHSYDLAGPPILWETMCFHTSGTQDQYTHPEHETFNRYASYDEALDGHAMICANLGIPFVDPRPPVPVPPVRRKLPRVTATLRIKPRP